MTIQEYEVVGSSKGKNPRDPNFDISTHNRSRFLLEDDIPRLNICHEDQLCYDAELLLGQATTLVCFANIRTKDRKRIEGKKTQQIAELQKENERLRIETIEVDLLRLKLARKTQEGLVLTREKTDLVDKVNMLEKKMGDREEEMVRKEAEFLKTIDTLKDDVT